MMYLASTQIGRGGLSSFQTRCLELTSASEIKALCSCLLYFSATQLPSSKEMALNSVNASVLARSGMWKDMLANDPLAFWLMMDRTNRYGRRSERLADIDKADAETHTNLPISQPANRGLCC